MLLMRARKVDGNLQQIVKVARAMGFRVYVRNDSLADLDVQLAGGVHEIWECKNGKGRMTKKQESMRAAGWNIRTIRTVQDIEIARAEMMRDAGARQRAKLDSEASLSAAIGK